MNHSKYPSKWMTVAFALGVTLLLSAAPGQAQFGRLDGDVLDVDGKPFPGVKVTAKNEQGLTVEGVTDQKGRFELPNLRNGIWILTFKNKPKDGPEQQIYEMNARVGGESPSHITVNFKEIVAKQGAAVAEARKKQEEAKGKFESMKEHFDLGRAALDQAKVVKADLAKTSADQRGPMQQKLNELLQTATNEFQSAVGAAGEKEENLHLVYANLGVALEEVGKYPEAVEAYQKAVDLKPAQANYFVGLANSNAKQGKVVEASAACDKIGQLDPPNAALCWRNLGIVLYMSNKVREAVEPLKKATSLDPSNADQWYLLGASMVNMMETKQVGDKITYAVHPGTADAYQKYLELAPTGRFAADAQAALSMLESLGAGVSTKVKAGKKKS